MSSVESPGTTVDSTPDFIDNCSLAYFIPRATDYQLSAIFAQDAPSSSHLFDSVEKREFLFFDESVDVVLVLTTPYAKHDDDTLQATLQSLNITIDAQIVNGNEADHDNPTACETIYSAAIDGAELPPVLIHHSEPSSSSDSPETRELTHVVWKLPVFLSRPRMRLQSPRVVFIVNADLRPTHGPAPNRADSEYMPSGVASSFNLLDSFGNDLALRGTKPRLSAVRVSRVAPITQHANQRAQRIKTLSASSLRVYPAVHSRVRFTHPNTAPPTATVIAMLEVDFTPFFDCEIIINEISLKIAEAKVESLTDDCGLALPLSCVAHDHITFMYRISPMETDILSRNVLRDLDIKISATALISEQTTPHLQLAWTATVDFTIPVNPGYGSTMQPIQRAHRPSQLSIGGESTTSLTAPSVARPDALPSLEASAVPTETATLELGITVTFTPPPSSQKIFVGDEFSWDVFVNNQSSNMSSAPRKLALVVLPKRRRNELRVTRPPSISRMSEIIQKHSKFSSDQNVGDAVLDDNVVHAMQRSSIVDNAELVCLSADVGIGPLAPGACHSTELRFVALKEGLASVDAIRIIDLGSNEHVDIRQLPSVTVHRSIRDRLPSRVTGTSRITVT
ncbi:TRAPP trafficking subunit Trs65-domain-containing protein [Xylariaceae sp. FL1019]|nr:TRAPP trafficking subunit Trs65-domain-containing protein [Xylariaceae sp. FL1019]